VFLAKRCEQGISSQEQMRLRQASHQQLPLLLLM
jgi:hypothetical protein